MATQIMVTIAIMPLHYHDNLVRMAFFFCVCVCGGGGIFKNKLYQKSAAFNPSKKLTRFGSVTLTSLLFPIYAMTYLANFPLQFACQCGNFVNKRTNQQIIVQPL